jgi:hypothetical protein
VARLPPGALRDRVHDELNRLTGPPPEGVLVE